MRKTHWIVILSLVCLLGMGFSFSTASATQTLTNRLNGRILLQVEEHGEAWYVVPSLLKRVYLGRMFDAYDLFRNYGIGISNQDLTKIQVADFNFLSSLDSDNDGMSDALELGFGTDKNKIDSDGDGFTDKEEIIHGYSPINSDQHKVIDKNFANKHKGKIFLQLESLGEAWYVNLVDGKRYFLGKPEDAWAVIVRFALGITNKNLEKIPVVE